MTEQFFILYTGVDGNLKFRILTEDSITEETPFNGPDGAAIPGGEDRHTIEISLITDKENPFKTRAIVTVIIRDDDEMKATKAIDWGGPKGLKEFYDSQMATVKFMKRTNTFKTEAEVLEEENKQN